MIEQKGFNVELAIFQPYNGVCQIDVLYRENITKSKRVNVAVNWSIYFLVNKSPFTMKTVGNAYLKVRVLHCY